MDRKEKEIWVKAYIMGRLNEKAINSNIVEGDGFLEKHELEDYFRSLHYGNNILENMDEKKLNALAVSVLDAVDHLSNDHIEKIHGECYYQWDYDWDKSWHLADYGGKDLEKYFNQEDIIQDDDVPGYPDEYSDGDLKHRNYLFQHLEDSVEEFHGKWIDQHGSDFKNKSEWMENNFLNRIGSAMQIYCWELTQCKDIPFIAYKLCSKLTQTNWLVEFNWRGKLSYNDLYTDNISDKIFKDGIHEIIWEKLFDAVKDHFGMYEKDEKWIEELLKLLDEYRKDPSKYSYQNQRSKRNPRRKFPSK